MSDTQSMVQQNKIYECVHGSRAYGLNTPTSDMDIKGIFIPSREYYFGMKEIEQQELGKDHVIYALKKFVKLARDCNPNIIEVLFVDFSDILFVNRAGILLRDNRKLFLSKKAKFTFSGYAFAQLQRIKGHQRWINNPQEKPNEETYWVEKTRNGKSYMKFQEQEYRIACQHYDQYLEWKKNRNPKRADLEAKYGYDTKHAMHLVRLLRMGIEILTTGDVVVKRPDREELLAIRNGSMPYEELIAYAESLEKKLDALYETSDLPHTPNDKKIDELLIGLTEEFLNGENMVPGL